MRFASWLSFGMGVSGVVFAAACGGNVSLGTIGAPDAGGASSGGGQVECKDPNGCGPVDLIACSDGSSPYGKCLQKSDGTCAWENPGCPADKDGGPAPNTCFDASGKLLDSFKSCTTADDCVVHQYQASCCGTEYAAGVAKTQLATAKQCTDTRAAGFGACRCAQLPAGADDGTTAPASSSTAQVTCRNNKCESTFGGETCGSHVCTTNQTCCSPMPLPDYTCVEGANSPCPISQRKMKKDILYLTNGEKQQLSNELMSFPLATYRYKVEGPEQKPHLGFIIDDVAPSPAVLQSGERVDLYGYSTMTVAALQVQAMEIAELKKQMEDLKKECGSKKSAPKK